MTKLITIMTAGLLLWIIILSCNDAWPSGFSLSWSAPTTTEYGAPLTDLAGYNVYFCDTECYFVDTETESIFLTELGLLQGWWLFVVTAFDLAGNESNYSNSLLVYCFPVTYEGETYTYCVDE